jgi:hypothetical protein
MTVNEQWKAYRKACYGDAVLPPIQEKEVHKAFHAGLWIGFALLDQLAESEAMDASPSASTKRTETPSVGKRLSAERSVMKYQQIHATEVLGTYGRYGIKILVAQPGDLRLDTDAIRIATHDAANLVEAAVMEAVVATMPEAQERTKRERAELLGLFPDTIFVEEIPNGYCPRWCCKHLPWFVVTTKIGRIKIGWRKRVINIDWSGTQAPKAEDLFPQEDVTKFERGIHAWGLEKAREYVLRILNHEHDNRPSADPTPEGADQDPAQQPTG